MYFRSLACCFPPFLHDPIEYPIKLVARNHNALDRIPNGSIFHHMDNPDFIFQDQSPPFSDMPG